MNNTINISRQETINGNLDIDTLLLANQVFKSQGVLQIDNILSADFVESLRVAFLEQYERYFEDREFDDVLSVDEKRLMITLNLEPPFNTPLLYANSFVLPIIEAQLGDNCTLGSVGAVVSLPGAPDQHIHRDHPLLFGDDKIDLMLPSYATMMLVPLVEMNTEVGGTKVWKGSHKVSFPEALKMKSDLSVVRPGSCLLTDYRLVHGGAANKSNIIRPLLYFIYYRPWFTEIVNYWKQPPMTISKSEYEKVPKKYHTLFASIRNRQIKSSTGKYG